MTLNGAYIWNNVTIGDGCDVKMSILDDDVHLENGVTITEGCVLGRQVGHRQSHVRYQDFPHFYVGSMSPLYSLMSLCQIIPSK